ncbi:MAG: hypothetical protein AAFR38_14615 [Planctomycetota bacterium]
MPNLDIPHLWCPGLDTEMGQRGERFISANKWHGTILEGGKKQLGGFGPHGKLYILSHGHAQMPVFTTEKGSWTAEQLAALLEADGLAKDQREIELLVCHAGESVNSKAVGGKLMAVSQSYQDAKAANASVDSAPFKKKYDKINAKSTQPTFFESEPERLLVPLSAQLADALKKKHFTNFRVTAYKCPVAQYNPGPGVFLDLTPKGGNWGEKASDHAGYTVVWQ